MFNKKKITGFTLVELLVVIGIIAVISTLSVVYFDTARMTARDSRRLMDVKQIQLALKMFYTDTGSYPTAITPGNSIANGGTNYLLRVPANPTPRKDGDCQDQEYQYHQLDDGQRYSLSFCLGDKIDDLEPGVHTATANGILNCPTNYVAVPGSATFNTNDFCVMKYEAKCANMRTPTIGLSDPASANNTYDDGNTPCLVGDGLTPTSLSSGLPIGNINQSDAMTFCQSIGQHLITNNEWMTIARNLEKVNTNWSDGTVGQGYLNSGNYGTNMAMDGSSVYGSGGQDHGYRRTDYLSTGETIWDFAGNVREWVDATCNSGDGVGNYFNSSGSQIDWANNPDLDDYEQSVSGPSDVSYGQSQGTGMYIGCQDSGDVFLRGGSVYNSDAPGIYDLNLMHDNVTIPGDDTLSGFRCVK